MSPNSFNRPLSTPCCRVRILDYAIVPVCPVSLTSKSEKLWVDPHKSGPGRYTGSACHQVVCVFVCVHTCSSEEGLSVPQEPKQGSPHSRVLVGLCGWYP